MAAGQVLTRLVAHAPASVMAPDPDDAHHCDLLEAEPDSLLVTGDGPLLDEPFAPARVITPREAVERLKNVGRIVTVDE